MARQQQPNLISSTDTSTHGSSSHRRPSPGDKHKSLCWGLCSTRGRCMRWNIPRQSPLTPTRRGLALLWCRCYCYWLMWMMTTSGQRRGSKSSKPSTTLSTFVFCAGGVMIVRMIVLPLSWSRPCCLLRRLPAAPRYFLSISGGHHKPSSLSPSPVVGGAKRPLLAGCEGYSGRDGSTYGM